MGFMGVSRSQRPSSDPSGYPHDGTRIFAKLPDRPGAHLLHGRDVDAQQSLGHRAHLLRSVVRLWSLQYSTTTLRFGKSSIYRLYLVGGLNPSEKYESQLGWWNSQYMGKYKKWQPNHQPDIDDVHRWTHGTWWLSTSQTVAVLSWRNGS